MNERLEEIKRKFNYNHGKSYWKVVAVERKDVEWLIGRIHELEKIPEQIEKLHYQERLTSQTWNEYDAGRLDGIENALTIVEEIINESE